MPVAAIATLDTPHQANLQPASFTAYIWHFSEHSVIHPLIQEVALQQQLRILLRLQGTADTVVANFKFRISICSGD